MARCALSRIEEYQNKRILKIIPLGITPQKDTYADPELIKILIEVSKSHSHVILISDDGELRIRCNQLVSENSSVEFSAVKGSYLLDQFNEYENALTKIL